MPKLDIEGHNKFMLKLWGEHINKERAMAYALIGVTGDGLQYSVHGMPNLTKEALANTLREAADALDQGKMKLIR